MNAGLSFMHKFSSAYTAACKPLCHALHLPQTAFDILLFLANNPKPAILWNFGRSKQIWSLST